jgi:hypothetical protein
VPKWRRFEENKIKFADKEAYVFDRNQNIISEMKQVYLLTRKA